MTVEAPPQKHLEAAIQQAMVDSAAEIREAYSAMQRKHGTDPSWYYVTGKFDKQLARQYARILAPRVTELLAADAAERAA